MSVRRLLGRSAVATLLLSAGAFVGPPASCNGGMIPSWWPSSRANAKDFAKLFEAEKEACFGRVYDKAHLAAHPQQKVTNIHVFRSLDDRKEAENWTPGRRQEQIGLFKSDKRVGVDAYVTFRDRKGYFYNNLSCTDYSDEGVMCAIDCDGGSFLLKPENAGSILLQNNGFVLVGGCGEEVDQADTVYFDPGKDDKVFRLDKKPVAACRAEEQKTTPIRLGQGQPLRERWKPDESFCYGRDYDAAHLAKHPQQKVASIRVGRLDTALERKETATTVASEWPGDARVKVALKLKSGGAPRGAGYSCYPEVSGWKCTIDGTETQNDLCTERYFHLSRAPGQDIALINRRDGLPIEFACPDTSKSQNAGGDMDKRKTKSDDASFRLTKMPLEACR